MSPEDGFAWKKFGEKEILGFKYPRYIRVMIYVINCVRKYDIYI
jgi:hypothetical protein